MKTLIIQNSSNTSFGTFGVKNRFLKKAETAIDKTTKDYWESLHYEAKSRANYIKFTKKSYDLANLDREEPAPMELCKEFLEMAYRKLASVYYETKAYKKFPNRFAEPDNTLAKVERNYKIKENYNYLIK